MFLFGGATATKEELSQLHSRKSFKAMSIKEIIRQERVMAKRTWRCRATGAMGEITRPLNVMSKVPNAQIATE